MSWASVAPRNADCIFRVMRVPVTVMHVPIRLSAGCVDEEYRRVTRCGCVAAYESPNEGIDEIQRLLFDSHEILSI